LAASHFWYLEWSFRNDPNSSHLVAMSNPLEYLFAANFYLADRTAREQEWQSHGRAAWLKPDSTIVYFICLEEQLAAVPADVTIHVIGEPPAVLRRRKHVSTIAV
jgi:hypothetical protein